MAIRQKPEHGDDTVETARAGTGGAECTAVDMRGYIDSCLMAMAGPAIVGARSTELRRRFGEPKRTELVQQEIRSRVELTALPLMKMDRRPLISVSDSRLRYAETRIHRNRG